MPSSAKDTMYDGGAKSNKLVMSHSLFDVLSCFLENHLQGLREVYASCDGS